MTCTLFRKRLKETFSLVKTVYATFGKEYKKLLKCDSSGGMSPVHVLLTCTRLPLSKQDMLASVLEAIKARPRIL
jgi:hypothetical protein